MKYKSEILEVVHQSAVEKYKIGAITEDRMREYDEMCLALETESPDMSGAGHEIERTGFVTA